MTLVELLVVLLITGIVLGMVTTGAIGLLRATNKVDVRTENVDHARLAVASLSRDVRAAAPATDGAPAFVRAEDDHAEFHARIGDGGAPVLIEMLVQDDQLIERVTDPCVDADGEVTYCGEPRQRYIASYLFNTDDQPIFTYGRFEGDTFVELDTPVDPDELGQIRVVAIELHMSRDREARVEAQTVRTEVRVPNLRDGS